MKQSASDCRIEIRVNSGPGCIISSPLKKKECTLVLATACLEATGIALTPADFVLADDADA